MGYATTLLGDLAKDPGEQTNLAEQNADVHLEDAKAMDQQP
jgi:hypothetical protein